MNLLVLFLPISVLSISLSSPILHAASFISVSQNAQAESPGIHEVRAVHHQNLNKRILTALVSCSGLLGGVFLIILYVWFRRHKTLKLSRSKSQETTEAAKGETLSSVNAKLNYSRMADKKSSVAIFDYQLLEAATNSFSTSSIMRKSGSRIIYRANFDEHFQAAVKKADSDADREFENEVSWLSKMRHQNIIKLMGYCVHGQSRFLVYELMENGSLETQLHGPNRGASLTWYLRLRIAVDVARALEYLHEHSNPPVVHRDLQSSNVLLDSNFNAKLSDFGFAMVSGMQHKNMKMSGTLGYVAPEYISHGKLTDKSDVYAFGVVLLELLTGRKPMENMTSNQYQSLVSWAMPQLTDRSKLPSILDPVIRDTMDLKHLYQVAAVAVLCVQAEPSYRPLITDVLHSLIPLVPVELGGSLRVTESISSENSH
ncbi:probable receptor-like protein kinase At1g80640 [Vigna radiata var. radiata]|uniref:Probable receptor-like protein kinase At1g80640 n=1 Tax=Vigna radiata var. radiata TaxID=3916 RepID=A0A1S3U2Q0_VIGRR|nr:probable receptor-like protein kinase At1g80640 [Vigna radiata var. radiata]XP_014500298.1 probable receptor-like protein kinase At1g80640 [Vigna radiata var. radiata]XP_022636890.1 probable receptor-like protein kinase At1g80640 [Vigna radiata var. radiata]